MSFEGKAEGIEMDFMALWRERERLGSSSYMQVNTIHGWIYGPFAIWLVCNSFCKKR
jgi:hypothetical protein